MRHDNELRFILRKISFRVRSLYRLSLDKQSSIYKLFRCQYLSINNFHGHTSKSFFYLVYHSDRFVLSCRNQVSCSLWLRLDFLCLCIDYFINFFLSCRYCLKCLRLCLLFSSWFMWRYFMGQYYKYNNTFSITYSSISKF